MTRLVPKFDRTRPIRERLSLARADHEISLLLDRLLRGATVAGRALAHAAILDALVKASSR